jgi:DnaA family protein
MPSCSPRSRCWPRAPAREQLPARHVYLWGAPGSGRSHLLRAALDPGAAPAAAPPMALALPTSLPYLPETPDAVLAIDDVDQLSAPAQIALFNAFNRSRSNGQSLLLCGAEPPRSDWRCAKTCARASVKSLIYEVQPLWTTTRAPPSSHPGRAPRPAPGRRGGRVLAAPRPPRAVQPARRAGRARYRASLERKRPITLPCCAR